MADVSITELMSFRRCRRAWDLTSANRRSLRKIGPPTAALQVGTGVHLALAAQAQGHRWLDALDEWYTEELTAYREKYAAVVGMAPSPSEEAPLTEAFALTLSLVERYFEHYGDESLGEYETVAVEQTFRVPIPDTDGYLIGTFDRILRHRPSGRFVLYECKTWDRQPNPDDLALNEQFMGAYPWAAQALLGEPVAGVLYDGIRRKLPGPRGGGEPFWVRHKLYPSPRQVATFGSYLPVLYREMTSDPAVYPFFDWTCPITCQVRDLCKAIQYGEDVEWLIAQGYTKGGGSQSFKNRFGQEVAVDAAAFA